MKQPDNHILVILGASGDLTERKLIPSLYDLFFQYQLPEGFIILGVGRTQMNDDAFRGKLAEGIKRHAKKETNETTLNNFLQLLLYISINTQQSEDYKLLRDKLTLIDKEFNTKSNYLFYLATPPALYEIIPASLGYVGLNKPTTENSWRRIIIEKPFGYNLQSATDLNKKILQHFNEEQIYRIDHYLGKETVQNVLVTRFSNGFFEPLWNSKYIDRVEISASENIGIENRGGYYDNAGALRDMVQNHLTQLVGLVAMEPPSLFDANSLRNELVKVFQSFRVYKPSEVQKYVVRGQYDQGVVQGNNLSAYRNEKGVAPQSMTETFVALKFYIDNWRWGGVPFYIRTGKRMATGVTEIVLHLKPAPHQIFRQRCVSQSTNMLIMRIQPDEGVALNFGMKIPGAGFKVQNVNMYFHYSDLANSYIPSAYERLILDCMMGDSTLYTRADALEYNWRFVDPILNAWVNKPDFPLYLYPSGSWGPNESNLLFEDKRIKWRFPCKNLNNEEFCEL